jgi:hypothetical protein
LNRKLLILDLVLVAALAWAGYQIRVEWLAARAREAAKLNQTLRPAPPPAFTPLPQTPAVLASGYAQIAQKMLLDRSRNPTVVIEVPPPPPPKPMPPLPSFHGAMNLGDGQIAVMSLGAGPYQEVRSGGKIGDFKLVDVNTRQITLEWDGQLIRKRIDELQQRAAADSAPAARTAQPAAAAAAPAPAPPAPMGPGFDMGRGERACAPNDTNPAGTVAEGFRKVVSKTPFGQSCRWEPVAR